MDPRPAHLQTFQARDVLFLPLAGGQGWRLKRYAILSHGRSFDPDIVTAATAAALKRLPPAGNLHEADGNHGVGFQIIHFAQVAVVSPVFYWQWGSVLANAEQMRAPWDHPTRFATGVTEVIGCLWEMEIVSFEAQSWQDSLLAPHGGSEKSLTDYLGRALPRARSPDLD
ncbi:MAG: hypothetical protein AAF530_10085 [Pseudomonadota bacterium]